MIIDPQDACKDVERDFITLSNVASPDVVALLVIASRVQCVAKSLEEISRALRSEHLRTDHPLMGETFGPIEEGLRAIAEAMREADTA